MANFKIIFSLKKNKESSIKICYILQN